MSTAKKRKPVAVKKARARVRQSFAARLDEEDRSTFAWGLVRLGIATGTAFEVADAIGAIVERYKPSSGEPKRKLFSRRAAQVAPPTREEMLWRMWRFAAGDVWEIALATVQLHAFATVEKRLEVCTRPSFPATMWDQADAFASVAEVRREAARAKDLAS